MEIIYSCEQFPTKKIKAIYLSGPSPRDPQVPSWRPQALKALEEAGYDGIVFVPEARDGVRPSDPHRWNWTAMNMSDAILTWIPRDMKTMPALSTNTEFGIWCAQDPVRVFLGAPADAQQTRYQLRLAAEAGIPTFDSLDAMAKAIVTNLGNGASREHGACGIPLHIWQSPEFMSYRTEWKGRDLEIRRARVKWAARIPTLPTSKSELEWVVEVELGTKHRFDSVRWYVTSLKDWMTPSWSTGLWPID